MSTVTEEIEAALVSLEQAKQELQVQEQSGGKTVEKVTVTYTDGTSEDFSAAVETAGTPGGVETAAGSPTSEQTSGEQQEQPPAPGMTE